DFLRRDPWASGSPHIGDVQIVRAVVVVVEPADAHASSNILDSRRGGNIGESFVAPVPVEILATEIVNHIKIGPAITVAVPPSTTKAVTRIVLIQPGFCCGI